MGLKTYTNKDDHHIYFNMNCETIDEFYTNAISNHIYPIVAYSTFVFLFISLIFYMLFVKPIQKINSKIIKNNLEQTNFVLEELNNLDEKYISQFKKIKAISFIDELTHINNRKSYNARMSELISLYKRYKTSFSMLIYDIDDFKHINDTYGHKIGDKVLVKMTDTIKPLIRKNDYYFRIGGEEFVIILSETSILEAKMVAEKIREEVSKLRIIENEMITISIGLSEVKEGDTEELLFKRVDALLYQSKSAGKNMVTVG
jgi:diguanylate cyclase (GGDEF)-like protein